MDVVNCGTGQSAVCREHFERIDARLGENEDSFRSQSRDIRELSVTTARMGEKLSALSGSLRSLTRALWGVTVSAAAALFGFLLWYIQSL